MTLCQPSKSDKKQIQQIIPSFFTASSKLHHLHVPPGTYKRVKNNYIMSLRKVQKSQRPLRTARPGPSASCHHPTRSAYISSKPTGPWSCKQHTPISRQPSWWSWPSCGKRAWSDHRNRTAYGRIFSYPGRTRKPYRPCTG